MRLTLKLGTMRKAQDFVVYPRSDEQPHVIQSDTYIGTMDAKGELTLVGPYTGGAYFHHLEFSKKRQKIQLTPEQIDQVKGAEPKKGDSIGGGVVIG